MKRGLLFLRAALVRGFWPTWAIATGVLAIVGGSVLTVVASDPVWLLVAVFAVLLLGAFSAWDEAEQRAAAAEPRASQTDLLERRCEELAKELNVAQEHYKVFEGWRREQPP
jgi:hypothetical protein